MESNAIRAREGARRFDYLDNLRSFVIFLVVVMHSAVTYGELGGWYYKETNRDSHDLLSTILFGSYASLTQAWFMGVLFFLAAFFATKSLAKRGPAAFVKERLFRLGIPLLIYMFVVDPFIMYFIMDTGGNRWPQALGRHYFEYLASFGWLSRTGPLWFAAALLLFSLPYAAWRALRPAKKLQAEAPKTLTIVLIILATGLAAFSIRLFMPIGTKFMNFQICFFASYIALFLLGLHAGERGWLESYPEKVGLRWFYVVFCLAPILLSALGLFGGTIRDSALACGGLRWQSLAYAFWESFVAIGFSQGIVAFFRKRLDSKNALSRLLAENSFGLYMFHAPVLVAITLLLKDWPAHALVKSVVVVPLTYAATLLLSSCVLRRIPGLRAVLK
jgi:glucans biosynthesis protein C